MIHPAGGAGQSSGAEAVATELTQARTGCKVGEDVGLDPIARFRSQATHKIIHIHFQTRLAVV